MIRYNPEIWAKQGLQKHIGARIFSLSLIFPLFSLPSLSLFLSLPLSFYLICPCHCKDFPVQQSIFLSIMYCHGWSMSLTDRKPWWFISRTKWDLTLQGWHQLQCSTSWVCPHGSECVHHWGLKKSIVLENTGIWWTTLDLNPFYL